MQHLVLSQHETEAEGIGSVPYNADSGEAFSPATSDSQYWSSSPFGEAWLTNFLSTRWQSRPGLIDLLNEDLGVGEIEASGLIYGTEAHSVADYVENMVAFEKSGLEAEAANFSRHILRARIESILGLLDDGHVYQFLDDTICIVRRVPAKPKWVQDIEALGQEQPTTQELVGIIRKLRALMGEDDFWQIDTAFRTIDVSRVSAEGLIALLRTTYYRRSSLETWAAFLNSVQKEIIRRNLKPEDVLFGLG